VVTDSDDDVDPHGLDGSDMNEAMEIGDSKVVGDRTWVRVESTPEDTAKWRKKEPAGMRTRHRTLTDDTREVDMHDDLLPTSHDFILDVVQCRADQANDNLYCRREVHTACAHESVGRSGVRSDGSKYTKQQRRVSCIEAGRKERNGSGAWRASWRCRAHPDVHICIISLVIGPAWQNTSPMSRMGHNCHNMVQHHPPAARTSIVSHLFIIKAKHANSFVIANTRA
jgi:hypothetical protein